MSEKEMEKDEEMDEDGRRFVLRRVSLSTFYLWNSFRGLSLLILHPRREIAAVSTPSAASACLLSVDYLTDFLEIPSGDRLLPLPELRLVLRGSGSDNSVLHRPLLLPPLARYC